MNQNTIAPTASQAITLKAPTLWLTGARALAFLAAFIAASTAMIAYGQGQYKVIPVDPNLDDDGISKAQRAVRTLATFNGPAAQSPGAREAAKYIKTDLVALMTQPDRIKDAGNYANQMIESIQRSQKSQKPIASWIQGEFARNMSGLALGNFPPLVRVVAVVSLGRLNKAPEDTRAGRPPIPFDATETLVRAYQAADGNDGLKAAALKGLRRYVVLGGPMSPQIQNGLKQLMTQVLKEDAPEGRSKAAHAFIQRYAVDILTTLSAPDDNNVGTLLVSLSKEKAKHPIIALHSAASLPAVSEGLKGQLNAPADLLQQWAARAAKAYENELLRLADLDPRMAATSQPPKPGSILVPDNDQTASTRTGAGGDAEMEMMNSGMDQMMEMGMGDMEMGMGDMDMEMGMSMGMGMMGVQPANPQPPEVRLSRSKLNLVLEQLHLGATGTPEPAENAAPGGLLVAVNDAAKSEVTSWVARLEEITTALNEPSLDDRKKFVEAITEQMADLRKMAGDAAETAAEIPVAPALPALGGLPEGAEAALPGIGEADELAPATP